MIKPSVRSCKQYNSQINFYTNLGTSQQIKYLLMKVLVLKNHHMQQIFYSVKTVEYNDSIVQNILRKTGQ